MCIRDRNYRYEKQHDCRQRRLCGDGNVVADAQADDADDGEKPFCPRLFFAHIAAVEQFNRFCQMNTHQIGDHGQYEQNAEERQRDDHGEPRNFNSKRWFYPKDPAEKQVDQFAEQNAAQQAENCLLYTSHRSVLLWR